MRFFGLAVYAICLSTSIFGQAAGSTTLKVGDTPPDFTLPSTDGGKVHLAELLGKGPVVLAFFPAAFTGG